MRSRINTGSVVLDKRDKVWRFYWWENGKRRSKALGQFPTKAKAWAAAKPLRDASKHKGDQLGRADCQRAGGAVQSRKDAEEEGYASGL